MKRFLTFWRTLFRLPYPQLSRREIGKQLEQVSYERNNLRNQLAAAVINGQWSVSRPLAAHIPGQGPLRSRFPRLSEEEIRRERDAILAGYFGTKLSGAPEPKGLLQ